MADDLQVVPDPTSRFRTRHMTKISGLITGCRPTTSQPDAYPLSQARDLKQRLVGSHGLSFLVSSISSSIFDNKVATSILGTMRPENEDDNPESPNTPIQKRKRSRAGCYTCRRRKVSWHLRGGRGLGTFKFNQALVSRDTHPRALPIKETPKNHEPG